MIYPKNEIVPRIKAETRRIVRMAELDRDELSGPHDAEWLRQERGFVVRNLADFRAGIMPNYSHGDLIADNASMFALMIIARREGGFKKS